MSAPIPQFAYLSDAGVSIAKGPGSWEVVHTIASVPKFWTYSPNGDQIAFVFDNRVDIFNARTLTQVTTFEQKGIVEVAFSPLGTYLATWTRFVKGTGDEEPHRNLGVWDVRTGSQVSSFSQKNQNGWNVQWTSNESYMARNVTGEVHLFDVKTLREGSTVTARLKVENLGSFSLSPNGISPIIAVFIPEKKGSASIYSAPIAQRSFFNADYVDFHWNAEGSAVLVLTHVEVDKTGQSYYGKSSLHFLSTSGSFESQVGVGDGPIHAVDWSPNSKEFIVVHGAMPSKATMFDHRAETLFEFPSAPRNFVKYSPHGRLSYTCEWSPDGRYIMTATLYKRLKVDNGIRFWHYSGVLAHKMIHDKSELWPKKKALTPPPSPSVQAVETPAKPKGVYRPPGARGTSTPSMFLQREQIFGSSGNGNNESAAEDKNLSRNAQKNQKKRGKKGEDDAAATSKPSTPAVLPAFIPTDDGAKSLEIEKRLKVTNKKLKSIHELKERRAKGEKLELTQLQKIDAEAAVLKEIEELMAKLK
ncbi:eukaryotic translation initiation factor eIF2A-domain-containing protein [Chytridium lagenaria]|nr:eukaryotic translation initiation factor eIF2A-domain-containing protein [Chytridium lagenaria]